MEAYRIVRLDETNLRSVPETAQSFDVIGRLVPAYDGVKWTWTEEVFAQKTSKVYPAEAFAPSEYIENPKRVAFMAMRCGQCAGIIRADTRWNGNVQIEDFAVDQNHRRRGVGGMLMDALVRWGRSGGKNREASPTPAGEASLLHACIRSRSSAGANNNLRINCTIPR